MSVDPEVDAFLNKPRSFRCRCGAEVQGSIRQVLSAYWILRFADKPYLHDEDVTVDRCPTCRDTN